MKISDIQGFDNLCTGCLSCANICPKNAISIKNRADGFFYPQIDLDLCVDCGLCAKACPISETHKESNDIKGIYRAYSKDETVRANGSSGGVFEHLANSFLESDGVVFGVAFSRDKLAYHTSTNEVPLKSLLRSKYIQSDVGNSYREVGEQLLSGKRVLFSGTPCQVRGLKKYLSAKHIDDALLTTADFYCHGVPSPAYFREGIERMEAEEGKKIVDVTFREKDRGWRNQVTNFYFDNNTKKQIVSSSHYYYYYFLNNYTLRDSCYGCEEYHTHCSDITVADCWGVEKSRDDDKGISLLVIHSEKGKQAYDSVVDQLCVEEVDVKTFNDKIYSHLKYDRSRKEKWCSVYKARGEAYVSTAFFKKQRRKNTLRTRAVQCLGIAKGAVKKIFKK